MFVVVLLTVAGMWQGPVPATWRVGTWKVVPLGDGI